MESSVGVIDERRRSYGTTGATNACETMPGVCEAMAFGGPIPTDFTQRALAEDVLRGMALDRTNEAWRTACAWPGP